MRGVNLKTKLKKEEKASLALFAVCWLVYAIICMTKNAYSASIASIVEEGLFTKSRAGIINSGYYLFYGAAQLLLVKLVDRISPVKLINMALIGALISMVGFSLTDSYTVMLILWSITGLLQFAIWPAVVRILSQYLLPSHREKAMVYMAFAYCVGMLLNYAVASVVLKVSGWRTIFYIFIGVIVLTMVFWVVMTKKTFDVLENALETGVEKRSNEEPTKKQGTWKIFLSSGIVIMLVPSLIRTMMDMGVKSWVPTMITENYEVSASFASVLTTILLLVNLAGIYIVNAVYPKYVKSEAVCFGLCFVIALPFTLLLLLIGKIPVGVIVLLLTLVTTFMYSGHQLINVIIPSKFAKMNLSGGVASLLNAVASFGAVISNFAYGYIAENYGWTATILVWCIMAFTALVFCFLSVKRWNRFMGVN